MADDPDFPPLPQATVVRRSRTRISVVWIIPILAAVVAIGIAVQRILSEGPTITIIFKVAEGLEAGKTLVKYKDVTIGQVTAVSLTPDFVRVEVTAKIAKSAAGLMVEDAKFFVVSPRVTLSGVTGLGTLLSGNYIGIEVGKSTRRQRTFTGLDVPPVITSGQAGRQFVLRAARLGSLGVGAPVYYHSLQAGQVIAYSLSLDGRAIEIKIFVNAPYDQFVNPGTRFWNASGVDVSVGAGGVDVRLESLVALLAGGLAFDTPSFAPKAAPAAQDTVFTLYDDQRTAMKQPESVARHYVLYFTESLRGLSVGAPVTLLGIQGGQVTEVGLDLDPKTLILRDRVEIVTYPERLVASLRGEQTAAGEAIARSAQQRHALFERMVDQRGLRGQLQSGSLLTGQLFVAFDFHPEAPKAGVDWTRDKPVLPTVPSTLPDIEAKLTSIVAKLDKLPLEAIGADVKQALASVNQVLTTADKLVARADDKLVPELNATLEEARRALGTVDSVLKNQLNTTLGEVNSLLEEARRALATANTVLQNTDATLLGKDAPGQLELREALQEAARAMRSISDLADYLERHPESLLRGKTEEKK
jgi:paraquat-inducible protein B